MLRLVKLNLYNLRLYKKFLEEKDEFIVNCELNEVLVYENIVGPDLLKKFQFIERKGINNIEPGTTYFLFDTINNAFIGIARVSFFHKETKDTTYDIIYHILKKYNSKELELLMIDLLTKIFIDRNKIEPIFKVYKSESLSIEVLKNLGYTDYLTENTYYLLKTNK